MRLHGPSGAGCRGFPGGLVELAGGDCGDRSSESSGYTEATRWLPGADGAEDPLPGLRAQHREHHRIVRAHLHAEDAALGAEIAQDASAIGGARRELGPILAQGKKMSVLREEGVETWLATLPGLPLRRRPSRNARRADGCVAGAAAEDARAPEPAGGGLGAATAPAASGLGEATAPAGAGLGEATAPAGAATAIAAQDTSPIQRIRGYLSSGHASRCHKKSCSPSARAQWSSPAKRRAKIWSTVAISARIVGSDNLPSGPIASRVTGIRTQASSTISA